MLTGKEIFDQSIIIGAESGNVQQQGVDVRIIGINNLTGQGTLPSKGKTKLPEYEAVSGFSKEGDSIVLEPGYYEFIIQEGCNIPSNCAMKILTRSSLVRMGCNLYSGLFDAGFRTDHMGCFCLVSRPVTIEWGARVAQCVVLTSNTVENLYDGQFQVDKQRNK